MKLKVIILLILLLLAGCSKQTPSYDLQVQSFPQESYLGKTLMPDGRVGAVWSDKAFPLLEKRGVSWVRLFPGEFVWGNIEVYPNEYKWTKTDALVMDAQNRGLRIVATILPYNDVDQNSCHQGYDITPGPYNELGEKRYLPCNMLAYSRFVTALVERYDGDGYKDMPGLRYPIKHWEVLTQPEVKAPYNIFFMGSAKEYLELLKATYLAIKRADTNSVVINGGISATEEGTAFFKELLKQGAADYIDVVGVIAYGDETGHTVKDIREILKSHTLNKSVWVLQASLCDGQRSNEIVAGLLVKSFTISFANGADKLFYGCMAESYQELEEKGGHPNLALNAMHVLLSRLNEFSKLEKINDGLYKATAKDKIIYIAWNNLSSLNYNTVKLTLLDGSFKIEDLSNIKLTGQPVFIEPKE